MAQHARIGNMTSEIPLQFVHIVLRMMLHVRPELSSDFDAQVRRGSKVWGWHLEAAVEEDGGSVTTTDRVTLLMFNLLNRACPILPAAGLTDLTGLS